MELATLMSVPYLVKGKDLQGTDCWGIIQLYYRYFLNKELADYPKVVWSLEMDTNSGPTVKIVDFEGLQPNDIVFFYNDTDVHCGVMYDQERVLHTRERIGPALERLDKWQTKLLYIWRVL